MHVLYIRIRARIIELPAFVSLFAATFFVCDGRTSCVCFFTLYARRNERFHVCVRMYEEGEVMCDGGREVIVFFFFKVIAI